MNEWTQLFSTLEDVFVNVSSLLLDAERMLKARGFVIDTRKSKSNSQNMIGLSRSHSIHAPTMWYPGWISRHFKPKDGSNPLSYVCVLLHARKNDDFRPLPEPVVSAGVLRLASGSNWDYWMAKAWAWTAERRTNGEPDVLQFKVGGEVEVIARPLASITSAVVLERDIVEPLMAML